MSDSDLSIGSSHNVDGEHMIDGPGRAPLKSTLLAGQTPGGSNRRHMQQIRGRIPDRLFDVDDDNEGKGFMSDPAAQRRSRDARDGEHDITLSTQRSDSVLDALPSHHLVKPRQRAGLKRENVIPGVGLGQHRRVQKQPSGLRPGLSGPSYAHPSPSTAARHERLRQDVQRKTDVMGSGDSEDSESLSESSSSSESVNIVVDDFKHRRSLAESTGNHQGFMNSPQAANLDSRPARPPLPDDWESKVDVLRNRGIVSNIDTNRGNGKLNSHGLQHPLTGAKKSHVAQRTSSSNTGQDDTEEGRRARSTYPTTQRRVPDADAVDAGSNQSGYAAGSLRKVSDGSSKGKTRSGTEANTSGETLVDGPGNGFYASHLRLPSGQRIGKGVPSSGFSLPVDLSGVTMALESPVKARVGVEHHPIAPEQVQAFAAATSEGRVRDLEKIADYIKRVESKVERVEDVSKEFAQEVGTLRNEWLKWKDGQGERQRKTSRPFEQPQQRPSHEQRVKPHDDQDHGSHHYRTKLAGARQIASDIAQSIEYYRATLAELKREENDLLTREMGRTRKPNAHAHSDRAGAEQEDEEDITSLRAQVEAVAHEVERLKYIVNRQAEEKRVYSASSPIKPTERRSIGVGSENPFLQRRKVSGEDQAGNEAADRIAVHMRSDAARMAAPSAPPAPHTDVADHVPSDHEAKDDDADQTARPHQASDPANSMDVSHVADERAERAYEKVVIEDDDSHDHRQCTHCARQNDSKQRRKSRKSIAAQQRLQSRQPKARHSSSSYDHDDEELLARTMLEEALLELETYVGSRLPPALLQLANKQRALLERTIKEELDEFYHARRTYCDLADELKSFSPDISQANRRILADHVLVAVEGLEVRASRIDRLRAALAATLPDSIFEDYERQPQPRKTSSSSGRSRRPRNSPPIVDDDEPRTGSFDAYRRIDAY